MRQPPNFNKMLKQVQQMQADMAKAQEQLKEEVVEASAGGGMVTVKISGAPELREIQIDPEAVDEKCRALSAAARPGMQVLPLSGVSGAGLSKILGALARTIEAARAETADTLVSAE